MVDGYGQYGFAARLRYNTGPSSLMHTHCVVYSNGHRALLNIVKGKWKMEWNDAELKWAREKVNSIAVETPLMKMKPIKKAA